MGTMSYYLRRADNYIANTNNLLAMIGSGFVISGLFVHGLEFLVNTFSKQKINTMTDEAYLLFGALLIGVNLAKTYAQNRRQNAKASM